MKPYQFIILRYVPDGVTQEFVNTGVIVYSPGSFLKGRFNPRVSRPKALFDAVDMPHFKSLIAHLERRFAKLGETLDGDLFRRSLGLAEIVRSVLPHDNSSFQWSEVGGGLSLDFDQELESLFERLVCRYEHRRDTHRRDEAAIWRAFREPLKLKGVEKNLVEKIIETADYEFKFEHAWKNGQWNLLQPVSFDYENPSQIVEKGKDWLGRGVALQESKERHRFYFLLGEPETSSQRKAVDRAVNLMMKIGPKQVEIVWESERETFSEMVASEMKAHDEETED